MEKREERLFTMFIWAMGFILIFYFICYIQDKKFKNDDPRGWEIEHYNKLHPIQEPDYNICDGFFMKALPIFITPNGCFRR